MQNVKNKINQISRAEKQYVIASLMAKLRDLQLCEDSFQDAIIAALIHWSKNGIPTSPRAWLVTTAHRKALDFLKRGQNFRSKTDLIQYETQLNADENTLKYNEEIEQSSTQMMPNPHLSNPNKIDDEQLKLIFMCCHPAINKQAQVALSLKIIGGLTTKEIASAFLTSKTTMDQRLVRAKQKIKNANIAFCLPKTEALTERTDAILSTIYLIYNESYVATESKALTNVNLANEAITLCRNLLSLMPQHAETKGLLALMLLQFARRDARVCKNGRFLSLENQDRSLWCKTKLSEGKDLLLNALLKQDIGKYQLLAAINSCHGDAKTYEGTDWQQIELLYQELYKIEPSPIVTTNILVAKSMIEPNNIKRLKFIYSHLLKLEAQLHNYQPYFATKADFLIRLNQKKQATIALQKAINLTDNQIEKDFLLIKYGNLI